VSTGLLERLSGGGEPETLRAGFAQALAALKEARFAGPDGGSRSVQELPWYVLIGAPGSGKTTALVNSGLGFPLRSPAAAPAPVPGIGGTRNCDWWFTDQAVLLDTAGRYTTQESSARADALEWQAFLGLLREHRPLLPLNGVLVTVSVSDLMLWDAAERQRYAGHVRMRLAELYAGLGLQVPVYALVTKSDLLAGFSEFFGELDAAARGQVWGVTFEAGFDPSVVGIAKRFEEELRSLERRLYAEMVARLGEEPDAARRAAIYRFPQQLHALIPLLAEFLGMAFTTQQDHKPPMLRGVYLTSGTQEGSPIDRVLGALARAFSLERQAAGVLQAGAGRSYFLTRLLREVVFAEAGLAVSGEALARRRRKRRLAAVAALAVLAAAIAWPMAAHYLEARAALAQSQAR